MQGILIIHVKNFILLFANEPAIGGRRLEYFTDSEKKSAYIQNLFLEAANGLFLYECHFVV